MSRKRFVSWSAVSSKRQVTERRYGLDDERDEDEKQSLINQRKTSREHCDRHGGLLVAELVVDGESRDIELFEEAKEEVGGFVVYGVEQTKCRPYAELHRLVKEKAFDVLIYRNSSRLGRDAALILTVLRLCHRAGIVTYATDDPPANIDVPRMTRRDYMVDAMSAVDSQEEVSEIKRRNTDGMIGRVERGDFAYKVPYPWIEKSEGRKRWVEVDPRGEAAIRLIVLLYLEFGASNEDAANELNAQGYKLPGNKEWYAERVQYVIRNIWRFAGYTWVNRKSKAGRKYVRAKLRWPAIITEEQAQAVEDEQHRRFFGRGSVHSTHLFSQCVYCAECGNRMSAHYKKETYKPTGKTYIRERFFCRGDHAGKYVGADKIREAVAAIIAYWKSVEDIAAALPQAEDRTSRLQTEREALVDELAKHRQRMDRIDDALADGAMELASYRRQVDRIRADLDNTQKSLDALNRVMVAESRAGNRVQRIERLIEQGEAMMTATDLNRANAFFRSVLRVYVKAGKVTHIETP